MRNQSEQLKPLRPAREMSQTEVEIVLRDLTVNTKFRVWYHPPEYCQDDGEFYREETPMEDFEIEASKSGRAVDFVVLDLDDEGGISCELADNDEAGLDLHVDDTGGIWAITVLECGLPAAEELYIYNGSFDFTADPAKSFVVIDDNEVDAGDIMSMYEFLGRWLRARGTIS